MQVYKITTQTFNNYIIIKQPLLLFYEEVAFYLYADKHFFQ